ncbi:hypothetical protein DH2020_041977 [Rehmannia glutinosa]|uniref:Protein kinase domain-containing protein n=1 Tax=Rehmannia glutinosa TaxID=99300 RepID=A0ABR0UQE6_REHGL
MLEEDQEAERQRGRHETKSYAGEREWDLVNVCKSASDYFGSCIESWLLAQTAAATTVTNVSASNGRLWDATDLFLVDFDKHGNAGLALLQVRAKIVFDPFGALANWNANDCDPCMWSGVECLDSKVVMLNLTGRDLEGVLAPDLGNLTHLRFLDLSKNHLSGTIPPQLGQLKMLEVLDLRDNKLSGTIPAELGGLNSLRHLFQGRIPLEIEKLRLLADIQFDDILTTAAAAGNGCVNRKFGDCFKFGSELSDNHADDSCCNLTDSPQPVNNVRRVLAEQSSNFVSLPPSGGAPAPSETVISLPSRSSGSFPARPNAKKLSPTPLPSSPSEHENTPLQTTNPGAISLPNDKQPSAVGHSGNSVKLIIGIASAVFLLIVLLVIFVIFRSRAARNIGPWKSGLSGQLQKAFITGVPKLNRAELETACEDFSNIISTYDGVATLYKGTLSSGVEIAVVSTAIGSVNEWSKRSELAFRKKIDSLSRVNHKNFVNLIGYCEEDEPFTRMMVFEYAPNGTLFEHLHVKELEHLDWNARMRIIMGAAYCLQYMHELNPPVAHINLTSKEIFLTDDYAAKIADVGFWLELIVKSKNPAENESEHSELPPLADAAQYLYDNRTINRLIDPTLKSFKENELDVVCEVIQCCVQQDSRKRPSMKEVIQKLRQAIDVSPEAATPRLSPLWWAELEILSAEAA